jgi:hypothetical protein
MKFNLTFRLKQNFKIIKICLSFRSRHHHSKWNHKDGFSGEVGQGEFNLFIPFHKKLSLS